MLAAAALVFPSDQAAATTLRLHPFQFNACDQFGEGNADCQATPAYRAGRILNSINSWSPNIVTLQELCRSTFDMVSNGLDSSWRRYFITTYNVPAANDRCGPVDHTWGIAIMARATTISVPIPYQLGVETSGEKRLFVCFDFTIGFNMRVCTTHLTSSSQATAAQQAINAANSVNGWIAAGKAVVVGGDFNLDILTCCNGNILNGLRPWYDDSWGWTGSTYRYTGGTGSMYEVDHPRSGGDGTYDENTSGPHKYDFIFGNKQNMLTDYGGDATLSDVSDHDPLRGAMTAHD